LVNNLLDFILTDINKYKKIFDDVLLDKKYHHYVYYLIKYVTLLPRNKKVVPIVVNYINEACNYKLIFDGLANKILRFYIKINFAHTINDKIIITSLLYTNSFTIKKIHTMLEKTIKHPRNCLHIIVKEFNGYPDRKLTMIINYLIETCDMSIRDDILINRNKEIVRYILRHYPQNCHITGVILDTYQPQTDIIDALLSYMNKKEIKTMLDTTNTQKYREIISKLL